MFCFCCFPSSAATCKSEKRRSGIDDDAAPIARGTESGGVIRVEEGGGGCLNGRWENDIVSIMVRLHTFGKHGVWSVGGGS